jgi:hypothetical protein
MGVDLAGKDEGRNYGYHAEDGCEQAIAMNVAIRRPSIHFNIDCRYEADGGNRTPESRDDKEHSSQRVDRRCLHLQLLSQSVLEFLQMSKCYQKKRHPKQCKH